MPAKSGKSLQINANQYNFRQAPQNLVAPYFQDNSATSRSAYQHCSDPRDSISLATSVRVQKHVPTKGKEQRMIYAYTTSRQYLVEGATQYSRESLPFLSN